MSGPKTHIQHTHSQHLSTCTQSSRNDKSIHRNRMGKTKGDTHASSIWSPHSSSIIINKLQVIQNAALRTSTGRIQDTNIQHLHDEIITLPIHGHPQLNASQSKQKTQHPSYHLHKHTTYFNTPRLNTPLSLTTAAIQQTLPPTSTQSLQQT